MARGHRPVLLSLTDQAVSSGTNFLTGVVIGRSCAPEDFGLYLLGLSLLAFATDLQGSLISTPFIVLSPRLAGGARARYTGSALLHQLVLSTLVVTLLLGSAFVLSRGDEAAVELATVLGALGVAASFYLLRDFVRQVSFASLQMRSALILDSTVSSIQLGGLGVLAYRAQLSIPRAYLIVAVATGVAALGWLSAHRDRFRFRPAQAGTDFVRNWNWGKWVAGSGIQWGIGFHLYPWLITLYHDRGATGAWAACLGTAGLCHVPLMAIHNYLGPRIAKTQAEEGLGGLQRFVYRSAAFYSVAMLALCSIVLLCGGVLVVLFYGAEYSGHGLVVATLTLGTVVAPSTFAFSRGLFALDRAKLDCGVAGIQLLVVVAGGITLLRAFGVLGAALGILISIVVATIVRGILFARACRKRSRGPGD